MATGVQHAASYILLPGDSAAAIPLMQNLRLLGDRLPQRCSRLRAMVSPVVGASAASTSSRSTHFTL